MSSEENYPDGLNEIIDDLNGPIVAALKRAYQAGMNAGRVEAETQLREKLASMFTLVPGTATGTAAPAKAEIAPEVVASPESSPLSGPRAPRGSVRPGILIALMDATAPLRPNEILDCLHESGNTLVKDETIRSTMHKMAKEGLVQKSGDGWILGPGKEKGIFG
jgi:hypothetical protein